MHKVLAELIGLFSPAYGGYIDYANFPTGSGKNRTSYVAGTGIMMNRQAAGLLARLPFNDYKGLPDDLVISHFLHSEGIRRAYIARSNFSSTHVLSKAIQVRLKSSHLPHAARLRMTRVHTYEESSRLIERMFAWFKLEFAEREFIELSFDEFRRILTAVYVSLRNSFFGLRNVK